MSFCSCSHLKIFIIFITYLKNGLVLVAPLITTFRATQTSTKTPADVHPFLLLEKGFVYLSRPVHVQAGNTTPPW
jgi:hypothetical protein